MLLICLTRVIIGLVVPCDLSMARSFASLFLENEELALNEESTIDLSLFTGDLIDLEKELVLDDSAVFLLMLDSLDSDKRSLIDSKFPSIFC